MKRRQRMRTASAVALMCGAVAGPSTTEATARSHRRPLHPRRLQPDADDSVDLFQPPIVLDLTAASEGQAAAEEYTVEKQQVETATPQAPQDATIRGMAYNDINYDGQYDPSRETPLSGVQVALFRCANGSRAGLTRTDAAGAYSFSIPGNMEGCYYIQYNVNEFILPGAKFSTPRNGETNDIYISQGQIREGVDAGIYSVPEEPTPGPTIWEWITYMPTDGGGWTNPLPTPYPTPYPTDPGGQAPLSPGPTPSGFEEVAEALTFETDPSEEPIGTLPIPDETATPPAPAPEPEPVVSLPLPSDTATAPEPSVPIPSPPVPVTNPVDAPAASPAVPVPAASPGAPGVVPVGAPSNVGPSGATPGGAGESASGNAQATVDGPEKQDLPSGETVSSSAGVLSLETNIRVQLENIATQMDDGAKTTYERACATFLSEQLELATPPIYNLGCEVLNQELVAEVRDRYLRALQQSNLAVDTRVWGEVEKTPSIQEPSDVKFDQLVAGAFNVQGSLFVEALHEEERANQTTTYYKDVGEVRVIQTAKEGEVPETDGADEQGTDSSVPAGVIGAIVAGVVVVMLALIFVMRARRRRSNQSVGGSKAGAKSKSADTSSKARRKSWRQWASRTPSPPPITSVGSWTSPCESGEVEIGINPTASTEVPSPPVSPSSISSRRSAGAVSSRVRREVMAPSGKLGIMVANTTGYGPAVHTIRPGSPMEGMVYVNDIIVSVNDVDTRDYTAEQITQVMKDTVGQERKIVVLSAQR